MEDRTGGTSEDVVLVEGLEANEVDRRLGVSIRRGDVEHRTQAFYLCELQERGLCQAFGYPSVASYAEGRWRMGRRTARELAQVGRALKRLPQIDAAFAEGMLRWSRVRVLCRVATAETEGEWLEAEAGTTQEELERMVRSKRPGEGPPKGEGLPQVWFEVRARLDPVQWQGWENAMAKLRAEMGCPDDVTAEDLIAEMVRLVLATDADGNVAGRKPVDGSIYKVVVAERDGGATVEGETGSEPIDASTHEAAASDGVTPPALRQKVFARDDDRCRHCRSLRGLHAHHVIWRSRGGKTVLDNLITLCARCHGLVHAGLLQVNAAPCAAGGVRFEMRDRDGHLVGRHLAVGPKVVLRTAQCAAPAPARPAARLDLPPGFLREHFDWLITKNGKLTFRQDKLPEIERIAGEWERQRAMA